MKTKMSKAKLTEEHIAEIKRILPDQADVLISENDFDMLIKKLNSVSIDFLDENYEATDKNIAICRLMDSIIWDNS